MPTQSANHPIFEPGRLGELELRNRIIKTATYEGMIVDALPNRSLLRHHRELAEGGVGMTTVAYCAVSADGRTFEEQLYMRKSAVPHLKRLTDAVHEGGAAASIQLGHCGGFSKNRALGVRMPKGPSLDFNAYGSFSGIPLSGKMTEEDIAQVTEEFAYAAERAREAGFDAVELHLGHGYLLSQFISPKRNRRSDRFGGSLENRMRFPLMVVKRVRKALGPSFPVLCKVNLDDGVEDGLHVDEAVECAAMLEDAEATALVMSGGLVTHSPLYLLRGERPLEDMIDVEKSKAQKLALRVFGPAVIRKERFQPLFFLPMARRVRARVKMPLVLLGGATDLDHLGRAMDEGFDFVAMGRALIHDPELIAKYRDGRASASGCVPCNRCITEMDRAGGVLCARQPWQLERREEEVRLGMHVTPS